MQTLDLPILMIVGALGCGGGNGVAVDGGVGSDGGGGGGVASCTITDYIPSSGQTSTICEEVAGPFAPSLKANCPPPTEAPAGLEVQTTGQYADGPCSRLGIVAGCRVVLGQAMTTFWYYETAPALSVDEVSALCAMSGLTLVLP
jgi:hypothetical protein